MNGKNQQVAIVVSPELQVDKATFSKETEILVKAANALIVDNAETSVFASDKLGLIKIALSNMEKKRLSYTEGLNVSLKAINGDFRELKSPLEQAKTIVDGKIHKYRQQERERIEAETAKVLVEENKRQKIRDAHEAKGHKVTENPTLAKPLELSQVDPTPVRKDWVWEVADNSYDIPRKYLMLDTVMVNKAVKQGGIREIPGLRIFQKETLVNRRTERAF